MNELQVLTPGKSFQGESAYEDRRGTALDLNDKKVLITGASGMLGRTLVKRFALEKELQLIPACRQDADITSPEAVEALISRHKPDVLMHLAAMTQVDKCESEMDSAFGVNALGTRNVAAACRRHHVRLIAISTDYVFDGKSDRPYTEFDHAGGAINVYGLSKYAGETAIYQECPDHVIARVSWLYGSGGPSFVHAIRKLSDGMRPELKVVNDQIGNPTSTDAVAEALLGIIRRPLITGTIHLTCEGEAPWYEFARKIVELSGIDQRIVPCSTDEFPRPAARPANSRLDKQMLRLLGLNPMPHWEEALASFIKKEWPEQPAR